MAPFPSRIWALALLVPALAACSPGHLASSPQSQAGQSTPAASSQASQPGPTPSLLASSSPQPSRQPQERDLSSPSSLTVLVNKQNPLSPLSYEPDDLANLVGVPLRQPAAQAAQKMFADAAAEGVFMQALSGYRSYSTQESTYASWVAQQGQDYADTASARPGYSEHQTGLALDIGTGTGCDLQPCFKDTSAARWVADRAHLYGFVVRYPWWEHETTGYWYEPWHLRYIGPEEAENFKKSGSATLEDYWAVGPAPSY